MPPRWSDIYLALQDAWEDSGRQGEGPPVPLILNGWVFTGDFEKNHRWQQTIEWANSNGLAHLIPELKESEKYQVVEFTGYSGPVIGEQFEKPKHKPSKTELNQALKRLQEDWPVIVGAEMAAHTFPVRFTGHKKR